MAVVRVGLKKASKTSGDNERGQKVYLVTSDTKIADDIDPILDASGLPQYNEAWAVDNSALIVSDKRAEALDIVEDTQEGFHWKVTVDYQIPNNKQADFDPRDRDWRWSKTGGDKREKQIQASTFDTSGYVAPNTEAIYMINLGGGDALLNTANEPVLEGVSRVSSRQVIRLEKYIDNPSDVGLSASGWDDLDNYQDKVNSDAITILDVSYDPFELLIDDVSYEATTENGFDTVRLVISIIADKTWKHVFNYVSAGYNQLNNDGDLVPIMKNGEKTDTPQLLDDLGAYIADGTDAGQAYTISSGTHSLATFSTLSLPSTIP
jgi:hypothetical protein